MTKPPAGEDIVILSRVEYDALVAPTEDTADAASANRILSRIAAGTETILSDAEMDQFLEAKTPLAFWRRKRNLTQAQLAEATGIAQGFLSDIENGNKTGDVHTLVKIARTLAVSLDDLVVEEPAAAPRSVSKRDRHVLPAKKIAGSRHGGAPRKIDKSPDRSHRAKNAQRKRR